MSRAGARPDHLSRWVFNRLAADYERRPGYPSSLVDRLTLLAGGQGARVVDVGAGTGHLALPLALRGLRVTALEPAEAMRNVLFGEAARRDLRVDCVLGSAEKNDLPGAAFDLALFADSAQWVNPPEAGREMRRLLAPGGRIAFLVPSFTDTPFLLALREEIALANKKARPKRPPLEVLTAYAGLAMGGTESFEDAPLLDKDTLRAVLRSLSYVGPALGPSATETLLDRASELATRHGGAIWARTFELAWTAAVPG